MWVIALSPLAFVLVLSFGINRMSAATAQIVFWAFAAVMGLSLSSIFMVYTDASIAKVFFITAATFGAMSLYGYTTKRDLTGIGNFLIMGLIGLIIAIDREHLPCQLGARIRHLGDRRADLRGPHRLRHAEDQGELRRSLHGAEVLQKGAIMGALSLYLDFINLFMMLLRLFGNRE